MQVFEDNHIQKVVNILFNTKILNSKQVYKIKYKLNNK